MHVPAVDPGRAVQMPGGDVVSRSSYSKIPTARCNGGSSLGLLYDTGAMQGLGKTMQVAPTMARAQRGSSGRVNGHRSARADLGGQEGRSEAAIMGPERQHHGRALFGTGIGLGCAAMVVGGPWLEGRDGGCLGVAAVPT
jgi:hypothetical protein